MAAGDVVYQKGRGRRAAFTSADWKVGRVGEGRRSQLAGTRRRQGPPGLCRRWHPHRLAQHLAGVGEAPPTAACGACGCGGLGTPVPWSRCQWALKRATPLAALAGMSSWSRWAGVGGREMGRRGSAFSRPRKSAVAGLGCGAILEVSWYQVLTLPKQGRRGCGAEQAAKATVNLRMTNARQSDRPRSSA